jgi:hypothetical protein
MNRFVSLLLAALCLAAVSLAQPAQAYWTKGRTYYPSTNSAPTQYGNTTISQDPTGTVTITSSPPGYGFTAGGSYGGNVNQEYTWTGSSNTPTIGFSGTNGFAVSGSCTGPGSANSSVNVGGSQMGGGAYATTVNTPNNSYFSGNSAGFVYILPADNPPTKVTVSVPLTANTSEYYIGTATASAAVTFGAPLAP